MYKLILLLLIDFLREDSHHFKTFYTQVKCIKHVMCCTKTSVVNFAIAFSKWNAFYFMQVFLCILYVII